jgi:hypothetical protein
MAAPPTIGFFCAKTVVVNAIVITAHTAKINLFIISII